MKKWTLFLGILMWFGAAFGQHIQCGMDQATYQSQSPIDNYKDAYLDYLESIVQTEVRHGKSESDTIRYIPVVFHVVHEYGEENISKAQILDQMRILNEDFRRQNADTSNTRAIFKGRAVDPKIEFRLAQRDPNGNCTDGITRTVSPLTNGGDELVKAIINWDYKVYLNIWVVKSIGRGANILGYARFPFQTSAAEDGIIVRSEYVGSIGTASRDYAGRTITHEIGHWLGLFHPFQDDNWQNPACGQQNFCNQSGDWVCDTPPVLSASFGGCPASNRNSCTNDNPDEVDMWENFMDYADGKCANMFSKGQSERMDFFLSTRPSRNRNSNILGTNNAKAGLYTNWTCAPKADFHVEGRNATICQGSTLNFEDLSWNGEVTDRVWTFEGGSPSTSTFEAPRVTYNQPGTYKVSLKVTNATGNTEMVKESFVTVIPEIGIWASPAQERFDSEASFAVWDLEAQGSYGWKRSENKGFDNSGSIVCEIDNNTDDGVKFNLYSPSIDMSLHKNLNPVLSFRTAYSMRASGGAGERLVVYASTDCGQTWRVIKGLVGITSLKSVQGNNPGWRPSGNGDWRIQEVSLAAQDLRESTNLMLRFEVTSSGGNPVYIDDINVDRNVLSTDHLSFVKSSFSLVPNPSSGNFNVALEGIYDPIHIEVLNILGQKMQNLEVDDMKNGRLLQPISIEKQGVYFVRVYNSSIDFTKRIVISE